MSNSVRPHRWQPTGLPRPWDSPGKNTGVCCHFLLQCIKVKSESEVAQSCLALCDPMDCSLPGSSVHGIFQARVLEWVAIAFSVITPRHNQLDHIFLFSISSQHFSNNAEHRFPVFISVCYLSKQIYIGIEHFRNVLIAKIY